MSQLTSKSGKLSAILAAMSPKERERYQPRCKPVEHSLRGMDRPLGRIPNLEARATPGLQWMYHEQHKAEAAHPRKAAARLRRRMKDFEAGPQGKDRTVSQWSAGGFHCPGSFTK